jgi:hypothetical protein
MAKPTPLIYATCWVLEDEANRQIRGFALTVFGVSGARVQAVTANHSNVVSLRIVANRTHEARRGLDHRGRQGLRRQGAHR